MLIDFLGGCCVTLFFLVTYQLMRGINFYKDCKERIRGDELSGEIYKPWRSLPPQPSEASRAPVETVPQESRRKAIYK